MTIKQELASSKSRRFGAESYNYGETRTKSPLTENLNLSVTHLDQTMVTPASTELSRISVTFAATQRTTIDTPKATARTASVVRPSPTVMDHFTTIKRHSQLLTHSPEIVTGEVRLQTVSDSGSERVSPVSNRNPVLVFISKDIFNSSPVLEATASHEQRQLTRSSRMTTDGYLSSKYHVSLSDGTIVSPRYASASRASAAKSLASGELALRPSKLSDVALDRTSAMVKTYNTLTSPSREAISKFRLYSTISHLESRYIVGTVVQTPTSVLQKASLMDSYSLGTREKNMTMKSSQIASLSSSISFEHFITSISEFFWEYKTAKAVTGKIPFKTTVKLAKTIPQSQAMETFEQRSTLLERDFAKTVDSQSHFSLRRSALFSLNQTVIKLLETRTSASSVTQLSLGINMAESEYSLQRNATEYSRLSPTVATTEHIKASKVSTTTKPKPTQKRDRTEFAGKGGLANATVGVSSTGLKSASYVHAKMTDFESTRKHSELFKVITVTAAGIQTTKATMPLKSKARVWPSVNVQHAEPSQSYRLSSSIISRSSHEIRSSRLFVSFTLPYLTTRMNYSTRSLSRRSPPVLTVNASRLQSTRLTSLPSSSTFQTSTFTERRSHILTPSPAHLFSSTQKLESTASHPTTSSTSRQRLFSLTKSIETPKLFSSFLTVEKSPSASIMKSSIATRGPFSDRPKSSSLSSQRLLPSRSPRLSSELNEPAKSVDLASVVSSLPRQRMPPSKFSRSTLPLMGEEMATLMKSLTRLSPRQSIPSLISLVKSAVKENAGTKEVVITSQRHSTTNPSSRQPATSSMIPRSSITLQEVVTKYTDISTKQILSSASRHLDSLVGTSSRQHRPLLPVQLRSTSTERMTRHTYSESRASSRHLKQSSVTEKLTTDLKMTKEIYSTSSSSLIQQILTSISTLKGETINRDSDFITNLSSSKHLSSSTPAQFSLALSGEPITTDSVPRSSLKQQSISPHSSSELNLKTMLRDTDFITSSSPYQRRPSSSLVQLSSLLEHINSEIRSSSRQRNLSSMNLSIKLKEQTVTDHMDSLIRSSSRQLIFSSKSSQLSSAIRKDITPHLGYSEISATILQSRQQMLVSPSSQFSSAEREATITSHEVSLPGRSSKQPILKGTSGHTTTTHQVPSKSSSLSQTNREEMSSHFDSIVTAHNDSLTSLPPVQYKPSSNSLHPSPTMAEAITTYIDSFPSSSTRQPLQLSMSRQLSSELQPGANTYEDSSARFSSRQVFKTSISPYLSLLTPSKATTRRMDSLGTVSTRKRTPALDDSLTSSPSMYPRASLPVEEENMSIHKDSPSSFLPRKTLQSLTLPHLRSVLGENAITSHVDSSTSSMPTHTVIAIPTHISTALKEESMKTLWSSKPSKLSLMTPKVSSSMAEREVEITPVDSSASLWSKRSLSSSLSMNVDMKKIEDSKTQMFYLERASSTQKNIPSSISAYVSLPKEEDILESSSSTESNIMSSVSKFVSFTKEDTITIKTDFAGSSSSRKGMPSSISSHLTSIISEVVTKHADPSLTIPLSRQTMISPISQFFSSVRKKAMTSHQSSVTSSSPMDLSSAMKQEAITIDVVSLTSSLSKHFLPSPISPKSSSSKKEGGMSTNMDYLAPSLTKQPISSSETSQFSSIEEKDMTKNVDYLPRSLSKLSITSLETPHRSPIIEEEPSSSHKHYLVNSSSRTKISNIAHMSSIVVDGGTTIHVDYLTSSFSRPLNSSTIPPNFSSTIKEVFTGKMYSVTTLSRQPIDSPISLQVTSPMRMRTSPPKQAMRSSISPSFFTTSSPTHTSSLSPHLIPRMNEESTFSHLNVLTSLPSMPPMTSLMSPQITFLLQEQTVSSYEDSYSTSSSRQPMYLDFSSALKEETSASHMDVLSTSPLREPWSLSTPGQLRSTPRKVATESLVDFLPISFSLPPKLPQLTSSRKEAAITNFVKDVQSSSSQPIQSSKSRAPQFTSVIREVMKSHFSTQPKQTSLSPHLSLALNVEPTTTDIHTNSSTGAFSRQPILSTETFQLSTALAEETVTSLVALLPSSSSRKPSATTSPMDLHSLLKQPTSSPMSPHLSSSLKTDTFTSLENSSVTSSPRKPISSSMSRNFTSRLKEDNKTSHMSLLASSLSSPMQSSAATSPQDSSSLLKQPTPSLMSPYLSSPLKTDTFTSFGYSSVTSSPRKPISLSLSRNVTSALNKDKKRHMSSLASSLSNYMQSSMPSHFTSALTSQVIFLTSSPSRPTILSSMYPQFSSLLSKEATATHFDFLKSPWSKQHATTSPVDSLSSLPSREPVSSAISPRSRPVPKEKATAIHMYSVATSSFSQPTPSSMSSYASSSLKEAYTSLVDYSASWSSRHLMSPNVISPLREEVIYSHTHSVRLLMSSATIYKSPSFDLGSHSVLSTSSSMQSGLTRTLHPQPSSGTLSSFRVFQATSSPTSWRKTYIQFATSLTKLSVTVKHQTVATTGKTFSMSPSALESAEESKPITPSLKSASVNTVPVSARTTTTSHDTTEASSAHAPVTESSQVTTPTAGVFTVFIFPFIISLYAVGLAQAHSYPKALNRARYMQFNSIAI